MLFPSLNLSSLGNVKMLFPPAVVDFCDDFQDFCLFAVQFLRLPDVMHYIGTAGFHSANEARVPLKDDRHLDGLNILQKIPAATEAKIALKDGICLDGLHSLQNATKKGNFVTQRTSVFGTINGKMMPKAHLHYSATPSVMKQMETKLKKFSRCKSGPKTSTPSQECHTVKNCNIYNEECYALKNKVTELEQDVILLKKQLADVLVSRQGPCVVNSNHCSIPPPPPPPPPPLHSAQNCNIPRRDPTRKAKISKEHGKENYRIDMREILKGINEAKLKPIDKSPGGTPVRPGHAAQKQSQNYLEVALRKRFVAFHPHDSWDEDDVGSP